MPHIIASTSRPPTDLHGSAGDRLEALGWEINANQYRAVHLAARYDDELEWFHQGLKNPAVGIAQLLQIHASTAREWIRVGHSLPHLPRIDAAFRANEVSYAKVRILTRWADSDNEQQLLTLAETRSADRLTTAVAKALDAADPGDSERDKRHHHERSLTSYTRGDGMIVIRLVLPPAIAKMILAIVETLIGRIAQTPLEPNAAEPEGSNIPLLDPPAGGSQTQNVTSPLKPITQSDDDPPADGCQTPEAVQVTLEQLRQRWRPQDDDDWYFPTLAQQGADAFAAFFLGLDVDLTTRTHHPCTRRQQHLRRRNPHHYQRTLPPT